MTEHFCTGKFKNMKLYPKKSKIGDGLIYINNEPLLIYEQETEEHCRWVLNDKYLQNIVHETYDNSEVQTVNRRATKSTYMISDIEKLGEYYKSSCYTKTIVFKINKYNEKYKLKTNDIIFATDDTMFGDKNKINKYLLGYQKLHQDEDIIYFLSNFDEKTKNISYKYYNSSTKKIYNLECNENCKELNTNTSGSTVSPNIMEIGDACDIKQILSTEIDNEINEEKIRSLNFPTNMDEKFEINYDVNLNDYKFKSKQTVKVIYKNFNVLSESDIIIIKVKNKINGLGIVNRDLQCELILFSNTVYEEDIKIYLIKNKSNSIYKESFVYRLPYDTKIKTNCDSTIIINLGIMKVKFKSGWNWLSLGINNKDENNKFRTIYDVLSNNGLNKYNLTNICEIRYNGKCALQNKEEWFGTLDIMNTIFDSCGLYEISCKKETISSFNITPLTENKPIIIRKDWNNVGYPLCNNNDIRDVFSSIVMKNMTEIHTETEIIKIVNANPEKNCELKTCNGYKINMKKGVEGEVYNNVNAYTDGEIDIPNIFYKIYDNNLQMKVNLKTGKLKINNESINLPEFKQDIMYTSDKYVMFSSFLLNNTENSINICGINMNILSKIEKNTLTGINIIYKFLEENNGSYIQHEQIYTKFIEIRKKDELTIFKPIENKLQIRDRSGSLISIVTGTKEEDDVQFEDVVGNIDYEEVQLNTDWSIWYPDTNNINDVKDGEGKKLQVSEEEKTLYLTYQNNIQEIPYDTLKSNDKNNDEEKFIKLGNLWAIEPKKGGLSFMYRDSINNKFEIH